MTKPVSFRMTDSLYKKIEDEANANTRSVSAQILHFLRQIYGEIESIEIHRRNMGDRVAESPREEGRATGTEEIEEGIV